MASAPSKSRFDRLALLVGAALSAVTALAACAQHDALSALPRIAASEARFVPWVLPAGFRRVCPATEDPSILTCDALVRSGDPPARASGLGPADLQAAYKLPSAMRGSGQTVAIVDAFGYPAAEADLQHYRTHFGLPPCTTANACFRKLNQDGQPGPYPRRNGSWDGEQALDLDMVSAICPNCKIVLIESKRSTVGSLGRAVDTAVGLGVAAVNNSYGGAGKAGASYYDHPGTIIVASSGDNGYGTQIPAGFPTVVSVGGTDLEKAANPRGWSETVWGGAGSGCTTFAKPAWQKDAGCSGRTMNDAAAVASSNEGITVYYHGWQVFEGTSVAAPIVAAAYALAGNTASLDAAQSLYTHAHRLYDITQGTNGVCSPAYLCTAGPGYDGPTGNGTPHGLVAL